MTFLLLLILYSLLFMFTGSYLSFLLSLEFIVVTVLFYLLLLNLISIFVFFLVLSVCEAVLGLSLLVSMCLEAGHEKIYISSLMV